MDPAAQQADAAPMKKNRGSAPLYSARHYKVGLRRTAASLVVLFSFTLLTGCSPEPARVPDGLAHHYDFEGQGSIVFDRGGGKHGLLKGGGRLAGDGSVTLDGNDDFVDLPNHILSAHAEVTLEFVVRLNRVEGRYARLCSFGDNTQGEIHEAGQKNGIGTEFLNLTFQIKDENRQQMGFKVKEVATAEIESTIPLVLGQPQLVTIVFSKTEDSILLYINGKESCRLELNGFSSQSINDINNWLGRSQWTNDQIPHATYFDFKLHNRAMAADEVERRFEHQQWRPKLVR